MAARRRSKLVPAVRPALAELQSPDGIPSIGELIAAWKRTWQLPGKDKESGRQQALQLFPAAHAALARKKDHGRAEASLIALYGARS